MNGTGIFLCLGKTLKDTFPSDNLAPLFIMLHFRKLQLSYVLCVFVKYFYNYINLTKILSTFFEYYNKRKTLLWQQRKRGKIVWQKGNVNFHETSMFYNIKTLIKSSAMKWTKIKEHKRKPNFHSMGLIFMREKHLKQKIGKNICVSLRGFPGVNCISRIYETK